MKKSIIKQVAFFFSIATIYSQVLCMDDTSMLRTCDGKTIPISLNSELLRCEQTMIDAGTGLPTTELSIRTKNNSTIPVTFFDRGSKHLLIVGGGIGSKREQLYYYAKVFHNYDILIFDYKINEVAFDGKALLSPIVCILNEEKQEVEAVVHLAKLQRKYDKIVGLGICYSAYIFLAAQSDNQKNGNSLFDALILDSCPSSLYDILQQVLTNPSLISNPSQPMTLSWAAHIASLTQVPSALAALADFFVNQQATIPLLNGLQNLPILFIHGRTDSLTPLASFNKIWDSLQSSKKMALITPQAHVMNIKEQALYKIMCDHFISSPEQPSASFNIRTQESESTKPLIVILTSKGGGGHMSATKALHTYLNDYYQIEDKYILEDSLPLQQMVGISGEQTYNQLLRHTSNGLLLNFIFQAGYAYFKLCSPMIEQTLKTYLREIKPKLVISVVPLINPLVFKATADLNIPFLLSPTDIDMRTFISDFEGTFHPCFKLNIPFQDQGVLAQAQAAKISPQSIVQAGFPLRTDFYERKNLQDLVRAYNIDSTKPIILLMMGAQGSSGIIEYVRRLSEVPMPFHLIVCIGQNTGLIPEIERTARFKRGSSYTIQGMTEHISDLMRFASLLITKSGTASVCEAIQMGLPMLLDATTPPVRWELYNHEFIERNNLGVSIKELDLIAPIVTSMLTDDCYKKFKENFSRFVHERTPDEIRHLVQTMITSYKIQS